MDTSFYDKEFAKAERRQIIEHLKNCSELEIGASSTGETKLVHASISTPEWVPMKQAFFFKKFNEAIQAKIGKTYERFFPVKYALEDDVIFWIKYSTFDGNYVHAKVEDGDEIKCHYVTEGHDVNDEFMREDETK